MEDWLNRTWYERDKPPAWLLPFEGLFLLLSGLRRWLYRRGFLVSRKLPVPVVVVGNITVGGTGKTPLVRHLCKELVAAGFRPGIISRGHGAHKALEPRIVHPDDDPAITGDEPLLLARETGVPVCVFPDRHRAGRHLLSNRDVDLLLCDDGLQHIRLQRDFEIAVIDGRRGIGNGHRLPAGPLRESASRLDSVDLVVVQAGQVPESTRGDLPSGPRMELQPRAFVRLVDGESLGVEKGIPDDFQGELLAVAGIGNPQRFFDTLAALGLSPRTQSFSDHHSFRLEDFAMAGGGPVIMTAKDAVKCRSFARPGWWYLDVEARFDTDPAAVLVEWLREASKGEE